MAGGRGHGLALIESSQPGVLFSEARGRGVEDTLPLHVPGTGVGARRHGEGQEAGGPSHRGAHAMGATGRLGGGGQRNKPRQQAETMEKPEQGDGVGVGSA